MNTTPSPAPADNATPDPQIGDTGVCRTCRQPITFTTLHTPGFQPRTGWSDGAQRDALVCFRARDYAHVPS